MRCFAFGHWNVISEVKAILGQLLKFLRPPPPVSRMVLDVEAREEVLNFVASITEMTILCHCLRFAPVRPQSPANVGIADACQFAVLFWDV